MKYIIKSVLFLSLIFSQNEIEGRWHIVGWDNLIMYQFVETDYFEETGLKYTIYVNTDGEFDDVLDDDYTGGIPDDYNVDGDTITISAAAATNPVTNSTATVNEFDIFINGSFFINLYSFFPLF